MHAYEHALLVPEEGAELSVGALRETPWAEFWLNPRMLRGSDFLMRWSQGVWSEKRLIEAGAVFRPAIRSERCRARRA